MVTESGVIQRENLPSFHLAADETPVPEMTRSAATEAHVQLDKKTALLEALRLSRGNRTEAARLLGVHRMTVWNRMKKYGIRITSQFDE